MGILRRSLDLPAWAYADSNLVTGVSWTTGTIRKNIVTIIFRPGATPASPDSAIASVHGELLVTDSVFWLIRVASHPDGCGVRQALEVLQRFPSVGAAAPDYVMLFIDSTGATPDAPAQHASGKPCPTGTGLLR